MQPYINIHTHHLSADNDVCVFNNRFGYDKEFYTATYFSIGIHPWDIHLIKPNHFLDLEKLIQDKNCLAIGECGLDKVCKSDFRQQKYLLDVQLQLAVKYNKPVIIHCVKAYDELIGVCKKYHNQIPVIIHGFNKSQEQAQQLLNKGFYISVSLPFLSRLTTKNFPVEKLFLETDDKAQLAIESVYQLAALKLSLTQEELKTKIYHNFASVFL